MARPPNVLFLWTDQQRGDALGVIEPRVQTPNLDRLAGTSTLFTDAICAQPVCTPTRGSVQTGLWPHQHGTWSNNTILPREVRCLPEHLPADAYTTGHIGKWHLGLEIFPQHGYEVWEATEDDYQRFLPPGYDRDQRSAYHHHLVARGYTPDEWGRFNRFVPLQLPEAHTKPAFIAERARAFIEANRDRPWCLDINTLEPHHPNSSPRNGQYDPAAVPLPPGMLEPVPECARAAAHQIARAQAENGIDGMFYPDETARRAAVARYYGLVSLVDTHFGRILDALVETGQFDDTLIVFTSDHGELLNQYGIWGKGLQYRGAVHVPLMIKLPGQRAARRYAQPVGHVDILPTVLEALGHTIPAELPGRSLLPACRDDGLPAADAFSVWESAGDGPVLDPELGVAERAAAARRWHAAHDAPPGTRDSVRSIHRVDGWRYSATDHGERELYDLKADPAEARNLAADPAQAGRVADLHARIEAWQASVDDFAHVG